MLALAVRGNTEIRGVLTDSMEHKVVLYANYVLQQQLVKYLTSLNRLIELYASASVYRLIREN